MRTEPDRIRRSFGKKLGNDVDSSNSSISSERDNTDSDSSDEHNDAASHFTAIFTASAVEYDARDVKGQLEIRKAVHILESMIKKPQQNDVYTTQWTDRFFQGFLIDTSASNKNTGGINQLRALQRLQNVEFDESQAGQSR